MSVGTQSLFAPLRLPAFRGLWAGSAVYFTGNYGAIGPSPI